MKGMKNARALLVMCLVMGTAMVGRAAGTYTLTCEPERGGTLTLALTGFNFKVTGEAEAATGMAAGARRSNFELSIRFAPSKDYETLLSMVEGNEVLRSCKLIDTESGGTTAVDDWNQMSAVKGSKNAKAKNNAQAATSTGGALEWILTNATITTVTAIGNINNTGAAEGSMQATIDAQKFSFTM
jgi:hypothetical protein